MSFCQVSLVLACLIGDLPCKPDARRAGWTVSFEGFGPVKIGMTVPRAEEALGLKLTGSAPLPSRWNGGKSSGELNQSEIDSCHYVENRCELPGVAFMVLDGKIGRIDITSGKYRTSTGARIGTTEAKLRHLYPHIVTEQDHYSDECNQMTIVGPDKQRALGFGTNGKVVTDFRVGEPEPVGYIEGCL